MLVLSRRVNDTFTIISPSGERLLITLVDILGPKARIGFTFPTTYKIYRTELLTSPSSKEPDNGHQLPLSSSLHERLTPTPVSPPRDGGPHGHPGDDNRVDPTDSPR